jgi:hypothetical protein
MLLTTEVNSCKMHLNREIVMQSENQHSDFPEIKVANWQAAVWRVKEYDADSSL